MVSQIRVEAAPLLPFTGLVASEVVEQDGAAPGSKVQADGMLRYRVQVCAGAVCDTDSTTRSGIEGNRVDTSCRHYYVAQMRCDMVAQCFSIEADGGGDDYVCIADAAVELGASRGGLVRGKAVGGAGREVQRREERLILFLEGHNFIVHNGGAGCICRCWSRRSKCTWLCFEGFVALGR